jgi:ABC-type sugar transport system ATPase subunit
VADQQFVELAAALSREAKVLMMDETTAALTPKEVAELFVIVRRLRAEGVAISFVTHHLDEVFEIADRITVMRDGEKVAELRPSETNVAEVVKLMVGRSVSKGAREAPSLPVEEKGDPVLAVDGLSGIRFRDISFALKQGEILGLAGLVGAGRTDVCRAIFGVERASSGVVEIGGKPTRIRHPQDAMAQGLAMVPEDRQHEGLLMPMTIGENGRLAALRALSRRGWRQDRAADEAVEGYLRRLQTSFRSAKQPVRELSGGNQQKVVLAKWLLTEPKVLILDEPTRGVDVGAKAEIHALIQGLVADGLAILLVSSDLPELLDLCDRVLVMREGRIVGEFDRASATPERVMFAATGQEANAA